MTTLSDVLAHVREEGLSLAQLEAYRDSLIAIRTSLFVRKAELKKLRAFYMMACTCQQGTDSIGRPLHLDWCRQFQSGAAKNMEWEVTPEGQELLTVQGDLAGLSAEISGLQSRVFAKLRDHT